MSKASVPSFWLDQAERTMIYLGDAPAVCKRISQAFKARTHYTIVADVDAVAEQNDEVMGMLYRLPMQFHLRNAYDFGFAEFETKLSGLSTILVVMMSYPKRAFSAHDWEQLTSILGRPATEEQDLVVVGPKRHYHQLFSVAVSMLEKQSMNWQLPEGN